MFIYLLLVDSVKGAPCEQSMINKAVVKNARGCRARYAIIVMAEGWGGEQ